MKAGKYGSCEYCGGKIPMARLNALPYATMCIECQREAERSGGSSAYDRRESGEESLARDLDM
jgi:DnaK suppressor protein